jgi:hypothetical protein
VVQPIVVLNQPWKDALGWSDSEVGSVLFDVDLVSSAVPAGEGDVCPRCRQHPADSLGWQFIPDPAASTPEQIKGRQIVVCLCKAVYSFDAVHAVDPHQPIGEAVVRSARHPVKPLTPTVVENITATNVVDVKDMRLAATATVRITGRATLA